MPLQAVGYLDAFYRTVLTPVHHRCIVGFRSLEESGTSQIDPVGGRAIGFDVGMLALDKLNACPRLAYGNND